MSVRDAVAALERLGLSNYQAQVFVALQQLGTGTAEDISDASDVPRSQVYGTADELADRGLLEVIESSPKRYRPVSLPTARDQLTDRLECERRRAFENLADLQTATADGSAGQSVATLRGRRPIDERIAELVESASSNVVIVSPAESSLSGRIESALRDRASNGVSVTLVTAEETVRERFDDCAVRVVVMGEDNPADFAGRALMVDGDTVLLSADVADEPIAEEAMWTAGSRIGRILARFMQSGIESGMDRNSVR